MIDVKKYLPPAHLLRAVHLEDRVAHLCERVGEHGQFEGGHAQHQADRDRPFREHRRARPAPAQGGRDQPERGQASAYSHEAGRVRADERAVLEQEARERGGQDDGRQHAQPSAQAAHPQASHRERGGKRGAQHHHAADTEPTGLGSQAHLVHDHAERSIVVRTRHERVGHLDGDNGSARRPHGDGDGDELPIVLRLGGGHHGAVHTERDGRRQRDAARTRRVHAEHEAVGLRLVEFREDESRAARGPAEMDIGSGVEFGGIEAVGREAGPRPGGPAAFAHGPRELLRGQPSDSSRQQQGGERAGREAGDRHRSRRAPPCRPAHFRPGFSARSSRSHAVFSTLMRAQVLVVGLDERPRRLARAGPLDHVVDRELVGIPAVAVAPVLVGQLPPLVGRRLALLEAAQLLVRGDVQPELDAARCRAGPAGSRTG